MKDKKKEMSVSSFKGMLGKLSTKTVDKQHRGRIVRMLCGKRGAVIFSDDERRDDYMSAVGFWTVRIAFEDFGDLILDNDCIDYLIARYNTIRDEFHLTTAEVEAWQKTDVQLDDRLYNAYLDWLAICEVLEFVGFEFDENDQINIA